VRERLAVLEANAGELAEGITAWLRGDDGPDSEAASIVLAETVLLHRAWVKSQFKR
jgi:hypothetical protein